jgi:peptide/nickel transport system substrate-binding protein
LGKGSFQWAISWSSGGPTPLAFYRGQMSKQTVLNIGDVADENWNRFVDPEVDKLIGEFVKTSDENKQKDIMNQMQMIFVIDAPALPLFPGPDWYEYVTTRFTGFPTKDDPYAPGTLYNSPLGSMSPLFVWTAVKPK